jgi:hypothetical protein
MTILESVLDLRDFSKCILCCRLPKQLDGLEDVISLEQG